MVSRSSLKGLGRLDRAASVWRTDRRAGVASTFWLYRGGFYWIIWATLERRREADLSTKQDCAQAPARVSCPDGDSGWPQGYFGAARARPQTALRVKSFGDRFSTFRCFPPE